MRDDRLVQPIARTPKALLRRSAFFTYKRGFSTASLSCISASLSSQAAEEWLLSAALASAASGTGFAKENGAAGED